MSNIILSNSSQLSNNERVTFGRGCAVPVEKGLAVAEEVIEDLGERLVISVEKRLKGSVSLKEVERMVQAAAKAPIWAQEKALGLIRNWFAENPSSELKGRVRELDQHLKFIQMASKAIEQVYSRTEDLAEQMLKLEAGSGEIYLDHLIAVASALPTLSKAMAIEGDFDRKWALSDVKNIRWIIDDEGRDLIKAIRPEIRRAKKEYAEGEDEDLRTHLRLIGRMKKQVAKLYWIADHLEGPLKETGEILRRQAKEIEEALGELGDVPEGMVSSDKERRKAFFERRLDQKKYKELTGEEEGPKSKWAAWLFLGLQALTLLRGAGSVLLGSESAKLKAQADQMQKELFSKINPEIKSDIEKDASRMGTILSDKWDALKKSGGGSVENALLRKLSPEAQEAIRGLVKGLEKAPSSQEIQNICDAVVQNRLAEHIPGPFHHLSIGEWVELFLKQEEAGPEAGAPVVAQIAAEVLQSLQEAPNSALDSYFDAAGPEVNKELLLHVAGREFGRDSGLEGYRALDMLSYVHKLFESKIASMEIGKDRSIFEQISKKLLRGYDLGRDFHQIANTDGFRKRLDQDLSDLKIGENLFWQGGWMMPDDASGHGIIYEITRAGEDDFIFRIFNQGDGLQHHAKGQDKLKQKALQMHEVIGVKRENVLRPTVIQGLQELNKAPKDEKKWDPQELYYNILIRMEGKISNRKIPIDQALPRIGTGICSYSALAALLHHLLGSNRLYERLMIEFEAKATWDYWLQEGGGLRKGREARELLIRSARQTIQDAIQAALPERNDLSDEELNMIRERMEQIIEGVTRIEHQSLTDLAERPSIQVQVQAKRSELLFKTKSGNYTDLMKMVPIEPAFKYTSVDVTPFIKPSSIGEIPKLTKGALAQLHKGNLESKSHLIRLASHEYVASLPLKDILSTKILGSPFSQAITPEEALAFVDDLVQIGSEFQWSLHDVFTDEISRTHRLPIRDAIVAIKLLTIADSIARQFRDSIGIALPMMLQQQMAVVLFGITACNRFDDPTLENEILQLRQYWESVDPKGIERGMEIAGPKRVNGIFEQSLLTPSFFGFEWAPAGYFCGDEDEWDTNCWKSPTFISENPEQARERLDNHEYFWGALQKWPMVQWTIDYLNTNPEKLNSLLDQRNFLIHGTPTAKALAALADEYLAVDKNWFQSAPHRYKGVEDKRRYGQPSFSDARFFKKINRFAKFEVVGNERAKGVLPEIFFHLWDLSHITNYLFTGGWNGEKIDHFNIHKKGAIEKMSSDERLLKRPTRYLRRELRETDKGPVYMWEMVYEQFGHKSGDHAQDEKSLYSPRENPMYILPGVALRAGYGEHEKSLRDVYGLVEATQYQYGGEWKIAEKPTIYRRRHQPKARQLLKAEALPHYPRETAQRLFGLSSKANLQVEETLAFFNNNPLLLNKKEYRELFNYMLFEQGLFLEEITKRTPAELSEFIDVMVGLTNKGDHFFAELLGNVELKAFFLDVAGKTRTYLKFAGVANELIDRLPDPVPSLRKLVQDKTLTNKERTYLRFILAKQLAESAHPTLEDLADIVTFGIQFDQYPLVIGGPYFIPFDDEIRRDLLLKIRAPLFTALMGPLRDQLLNRIVGKTTSWQVHGDFPLFQSEDGQITVDVLKGTYYEKGNIPRELPLAVRAHLLEKGLFSDKELDELKAVQLDNSTFELIGSRFGRIIFKLIGKEGAIQREIGNRLYQLQEEPTAALFGNSAVVFGNWVWVYRDEKALITDKQTDDVLYQVSYKGDEATIHRQGTGLVMANITPEGSFGFITAIEDPTWIRGWADPKTGKLVSIELPRFALSFTVKGGKVHCDQLPGFYLSEKQHHPYLGKIENYQVLEQMDRDQNRHQVVILPNQIYYKNSRKRALDPDAKLVQDKKSSKEKYLVFDIDFKKEKLSFRLTEGQFLLGYLNLWHHDYAKAAELIRGYGGQRGKYSEAEAKLLDTIFAINQGNNDHSPQGLAVRLIAAAALIRNKLDFGGSILPAKAWEALKLYYHQLEYIGELALTKEEEALLLYFCGTQRPNTIDPPNLHFKSVNGTLGSWEWDNIKKVIENAHSDLGPALLRPGLNGKDFYTLYNAIARKAYRNGYQLLTGSELPKDFDESLARIELLTALKMVVSSLGTPETTQMLAYVLACALVNPTSLPSAEEFVEKLKNGINLNSVDFNLKFNRTEVAPPILTREVSSPRAAPPRLESEETVQHCVKLFNPQAFTRPVIENFEAYIEKKEPSAEQIAKSNSVTKELEKIFQVKTDEPIADLQLAEMVRGIGTFGQSGEAKPAPQYTVRDIDGLKKKRLEIEQQLFLMTGREGTAVKQLLEKANQLPTHPTLQAQLKAALACGDSSKITLDDLALALINRNHKNRHDGLLQETMQILIHATERQRLLAVVEAIKDLENATGKSAQEISNLAAQLKRVSEATRQFNPAERPEYLVFEYYISILLQGRQVEALNKLVEKVKRGEGIHSREFGNVLEMIMGSGKTAVLTPLLAWLEANGVQLSIIVMPEGLMPEKTQELEQRFGEAFGRSIDVLHFDRSSDFGVEPLRRLLTRLEEARAGGKLVMISSGSLQSLLLCFIEDALNKVSPERIDLFRKVLAELRNRGSITFDELDVMADVLKLQIFSMAKPGGAGERQLANQQLKETTADLLKYMVTDTELAPIVAKPFTAEVHHAQVKPRLLEAILERRIGEADTELNQFLQSANKKLVREYLQNAPSDKAFDYIDRIKSMSLKNTLAVLKYQLGKMIPETFSRKVDEHYGIVESVEVDPTTKHLSKPLEKGSWETGSEHGTSEETIDYTLLNYLSKGIPEEFVRQEVFALRTALLAALDSNEIDRLEDSPFYTQLMALTGGKHYALGKIGDPEISEMTKRINQHDPVQNIELAMKYAVEPQLAVFPYQLRADAQMLLQMVRLSRGFSGTLWNWQTFAALFSKVELSDTEAKTLHLLQANSPSEVTIVDGPDLDSKLNQLFLGKPSVAIVDVGNMFGDSKGEQIGQKILEKGPWKGVPYYDEENKLLVALRERPPELLANAGVDKEDRAPYWKQELCTGSDIPLGSTAEAVVTFGRYTMMRDLLQTVWRLRKLDIGQKVRFAVDAADRTVIIDTLEKLLKQKIEKLELPHLLLYAAYIQAMRIGDDNHRSLGQQLRGQLISQVFDVIIQPEVTPEEIIDIILATQDLFLTMIDPNPYNRYGKRETMLPAKVVVEAELAEILESKPMAAFREHPILKKYCNADAIETRLKETAAAMMPRLAQLLASPSDTGVHLKVKTQTKVQAQTKIENKNKEKTQIQLRTALHKKAPQQPTEALKWTKELLFSGKLLKSVPVEEIQSASIDYLPTMQISVAEALKPFHPIASFFDRRLVTSLNRMPIYQPRDPEKQISFIPYDEYEDPVTTHALLIEENGQIGMMVLDQDDASDIEALLHDSNERSPKLALINLSTDKVWRQSNNPFDLEWIRQNPEIQKLKAQAKMVNGFLIYTEAEQEALKEFLRGKDVNAIREWFSQIVIGNRQQSLERFPTSDLEKVFQQAIKMPKDLFPQEVESQLKALLPKIENREEHEEIEYLKTNKIYFRLKAYPDLVFKLTSPYEKRGVRYQNIIRAKKICADNDLDHLMIPQAKLYKFGSIEVLAEERMDINHAESAQKEFYHKYSQDLSEAVRQLAIFVAFSGFNDVTPRNIPLLNEPEDFQGSRRIVLIDLELMNSNVEGFIGSHNGSCGLIGCVTEDQMDLVVEEALKKGIDISEDRKKHRLQELASEKKLRQYHESKKILTGREFVHVDLETLGLDLNEVEARDGMTYTMQKAIADVLQEINRQIQAASDEESIQGKRYVLLNTNQEPFRQYDRLGAPGKGYRLNEEESKQLWLPRIIQALIDKGHIFKLDKENGHGYFIQA